MSEEKLTVYIETSIISYLAAHPSRDLVTAANQQLTHTWWNEHRHEYEVFVSQFVYDECSAGNPVMAQRRMQFLSAARELSVTQDVSELADELIQSIPLPKNAHIDAAHIATATVHGMDLLLTLNCSHIANAKLLGRIEDICAAAGYDCPRICTPQQMLEEEDNVA